MNKVKKTLEDILATIITSSKIEGHTSFITLEEIKQRRSKTNPGKTIKKK